MSHLATIKTEVKDIAAVRAMCAEMGWTFNENATQYKGWGWQKGCAHSITVPGATCGCQIGLTRTATGYQIGFDDAGLVDTVGKDGGKFLQLYGVHKATLEAQKHGYIVTRTKQANGSIKLVASGM